jgi:hypothetical protein
MRSKTKQNNLKFRDIISITILLLIFSGCSNPTKKEKVSNEANTNTKEKVVKADSVAAQASATKEQLERLIGKWQRTDGEYVLEIFAVKDDKTLNAGYFNPKQINVEKAIWLYRDGKFYIQVIFRDVNYPGSAYTLEYDAGKDYFFGQYFQAVEKINYDVILTRKK